MILSRSGVDSRSSTVMIMTFYRCQYPSLHIVFILTVLLSCSFSFVLNAQFDNLRNMSLAEIQDLLRVWYRYYQILERQGLTTESDRRKMGEFLSYSFS